MLRGSWATVSEVVGLVATPDGPAALPVRGLSMVNPKGFRPMWSLSPGPDRHQLRARAVGSDVRWRRDRGRRSTPRRSLRSSSLVEHDFVSDVQALSRTLLVADVAAGAC
jgi:hypothetical protein